MNKIKYKNIISCYLIKASYTIEAALLMPIVLFVILALIYLSFYLYDYNKLLSLINEVSLKSSWVIRHNADFHTGEVTYTNLNARQIYWRNMDLTQERRIIKYYLNNTINKGLIITDVINTHVIESSNNIEIEVNAEVNIPLIHIKKYFTNNDKITLNISTVTQVHEPTEFVRNADLLIEIGSNIKGVDELIDNLKKLLEKVGI